MIDLYEVIKGLFSASTTQIIEGIRFGASGIFNSHFFTISLALIIAIAGYLIATKQFKSEEMVHKIIWTLSVFTFAKLIIADKSFYTYFISLINIPRDEFMIMISEMVTGANKNASLGQIIGTLKIAVYAISDALFSQSGWTNPTPFVFGVIVWISGTFLIILTLLNSVFSIFLSDIIISLLPIVVITLIFKKTEYIFFAWVKLYISISLYAPFTILFGLVSVHVGKYTMTVALMVQEDLEKSLQHILGLVVAQALIAVGIMKIPNIINQLVGSANEGSSMTSGVGTVSAGATMIGAFSKYSGISFAGNKAKQGMNKVKNSLDNKLSSGTDKVNI